MKPWKKTPVRPMRQDRDMMDWVTTVVAVVALLWQVGEHIARSRAESPAITVTGRFCHVLTQQDFGDVLNSLYEASPLMNVGTREHLKSDAILASFREDFRERYESRLFRLVIKNTHNVPVSVSECSTRDLRVKSSNSNLIVRCADLFASLGKNTPWETYPIVYLGPHETKQVEVLVSFIAVDREADGTKVASRPLMKMRNCV